MNKALLLLIVLFVPMSLVTAQEARHFSLGLGFEGNMNTRQGVALGGTLGADYGITPNLAAGIKFGFSHNFGKIMTMEPEAFVRWYFMNVAGLPLFVQLDQGTSIIFEEGKIHTVFLGGLAAGIRIPLNRWYVESSLRTGYPFVWGAGLTAGYRF